MERPFRPSAALWVVFAATAIVRIGYGGIMPVLPVYAEQHGLSTFMIAVMTNAFLVSNTVFQSLAGEWSDRWGRRPLLIAGALLYTAAAGLFLIDGGPWFYVLLRALEGLGASAFGPTVRAYVADLTAPSERGRAYGWLSAFDSAGILFGPLVGGVAQILGGARAPFAACAVLGLLAVVLLLVTGRRSAVHADDAMPAMAGAEEPLAARTSAWALLRSPALWAVALPGLGMAYLTGLYSVIWSLYLQRTGASLWQINLSYTLFAVPLVVLMVPFGALGDRVGRPLMVALGGIGSVLAVIGYGIFPIPNILIGLSVMDGVAAAMFSPASQAFMADVTPPAIRGKFIGLVGSISTGATVVFATLIGYLFDRVSPMWLFAGGAVALAFSTSTSVVIMMRHAAGGRRYPSESRGTLRRFDHSNS